MAGNLFAACSRWPLLTIHHCMHQRGFATVDHHHIGINADKRVPCHLLTSAHTLQQKAVGPQSRFAIGRNRSLHVGENVGVEWEQGTTCPTHSTYRLFLCRCRFTQPFDLFKRGIIHTTSSILSPSRASMKDTREGGYTNPIR